MANSRAPVPSLPTGPSPEEDAEKGKGGEGKSFKELREDAPGAAVTGAAAGGKGKVRVVWLLFVTNSFLV